MRNALLDNQVVTLASEEDAGHTRTFTILETLGSGSSCIAYKAIDTRTDSHIPVIIKECFPRISAARNCDSTLIWESAEEEFRAKDRFRTAFSVQLSIQSADTTMNTVTH